MEDSPTWDCPVSEWARDIAGLEARVAALFKSELAIEGAVGVEELVGDLSKDRRAARRAAAPAVQQNGPGYVGRTHTAERNRPPQASLTPRYVVS